ncbi:hypothetical protein [Dechloromonas sp. HYN0024]|uniref:hypothetical protein n=1 Tax=Dechloromonas sp. HYN0024 TaxID=2231055 RepID=UPI0013C2AD00|nr:hypothetical protein [Dechloromonas sp. HYN0024]
MMTREEARQFRIETACEIDDAEGFIRKCDEEGISIPSVVLRNLLLLIAAWKEDLELWTDIAEGRR